MKKITILGGDSRLKIAAEQLRGFGYAVNTPDSPEAEDLSGCDVLLLPVPTTRDGETLFAPECRKKIYLSDIARLVPDSTLILSCNYMFEGKNCIDYGKNDAYCLLNAVPTAEGAIALAIEKTPFTLWGSRVLVIGCGRVGRILAGRLKSLGCRVTVSARKASDFALISAMGCYAAKTSEIKKHLNCDIIFNTVDVKVIEDGDFEDCTAELIMDLSSRGGYDSAAAEAAGITALKAPGLPGKTAPQTAGEILARIVREIITTTM